VRAGFRRYAIYRRATLAGAFTNTVFGVIRVSIFFAAADAAGGSVAGYDRAALSTYTWVGQGLIAVVWLRLDAGDPAGVRGVLRTELRDLTIAEPDIEDVVARLYRRAAAARSSTVDSEVSPSVRSSPGTPRVRSRPGR
jgi:hypothetical protein